MTCVSEFLEQKAALEPGWGGPGEVRALLDDGVPPGPGEEEHDRQVEEWVQRRMIVLEETRYRRGKGAADSKGTGDSGEKGTGESGEKGTGEQGEKKYNGW